MGHGFCRGDKGDPKPRDRRSGGGSAIVEVHGRREIQHIAFLTPLQGWHKTPVSGRKLEPQMLMPGQVGGHLEGRRFCQVRRGGAQAKMHLPYGSADLIRVRHRTAANGAIHALLHQIRHPFAAADIKVDIREPGREIRQRRHNQQDANRGRHFDSNPTANNVAAFGNRRFQLVYLVNQRSGPAVISRAFGGG